MSPINDRWKFERWARRKPKPPPPPPAPSVAPLPDLFRRPLAWVNSDDPHNGAPLDIFLPLAKRYGYGGVVVRVAHGVETVPLAPLARWLSRVRQEMFVLGWQWSEGNVTEEAVVACNAAAGLILDGLVGNLEKAAEGKAERYFEAIRADSYGATLALGYSPEPRLDQNHARLRQLGVAYMPQAYPSENGYDVHSCVVVAKTMFGYAPSQVVPLIGVHDASGGPSSTVEGARQARMAGCPSACLYPVDASLNAPEAWEAVGLVRR